MTSARTTPPDIVCFSHLRWNFVFQRPQHVMVRWARDRRVFFIEEPEWGATEIGLKLHRDQSGVMVVTPQLPAEAKEPAVLTRLIDGLYAEHHIVDSISWYYTPMAHEFTANVRAHRVVYDCMDELSSFKGAPSRLPELERELLKRAHVVFTGGHRLYSVKKDLHPNVHAFPSSLDVAHFSKARLAQPDPADQAAIPHPRLGFFGVIDERFDAELISELARRRPDWHFVFVGPSVKIDPQSLPHAANIHWLGFKRYEELPSYLSTWDVALLPFAINDATRYISPTKTPEYLAGGLPVVSTAVHDVIHPYEDEALVRVGRSVDAFETAIALSLNENSDQRKTLVDRYLASQSWDRTFLSMKRLVEAPTDGIALQRAPRVRRPAFDYLVAGAGFAGAVMAERLASNGKRVLVTDKRPHIGGNAYDHLDAAGIRVHRYGPHIFHTNSTEVFDYLSRFTQWRPYEHRVLAHVDGKLLPIPINLDTVNGLYGWNLDALGLERYFQSVAERRSSLRTSEDVIVSKVGRALYEKFFHNYTLKQWGLSPAELDAAVIARIPVRTNRDDRYFTDTHQVMPSDGYTALFEQMLDHPNITVELGCDSREVGQRISYGELIYTGPIDDYFGCCFGRLPYRSLEFQFETLSTPQHQPVAVVNYPNEHRYTRVTEFKHLTEQHSAKTTVVYEFPTDEGAPYYPVPRPHNQELYRKYHALAQKTPRVHFVGRLATYRYYNMDQVVAQALTLASRLTGVTRSQLLSSQV